MQLPKVRRRGSSPRAVALHPSILSEDETMQLFAKVLDHVITLWFTMNKEVKTNLLLEADNGFNFLFDELLIFLIGDRSLVQLSTGSTNLLRLL